MLTLHLVTEGERGGGREGEGEGGEREGEERKEGGREGGEREGEERREGGREGGRDSNPIQERHLFTSHLFLQSFVFGCSHLVSPSLPRIASAMASTTSRRLPSEKLGTLHNPSRPQNTSNALNFELYHAFVVWAWFTCVHIPRLLPGWEKKSRCLFTKVRLVSCGWTACVCVCGVLPSFFFVRKDDLAV